MKEIALTIYQKTRQEKIFANILGMMKQKTIKITFTKS